MPPTHKISSYITKYLEKVSHARLQVNNQAWNQTLVLREIPMGLSIFAIAHEIEQSCRLKKSKKINR